MRKYIGLILGAVVFGVACFLGGWVLALPEMSGGLFAIAGAVVGAVAGTAGTLAAVRSQERMAREQRGSEFWREELRTLEDLFSEYVHVVNRDALTISTTALGQEPIKLPESSEKPDVMLIFGRLTLVCPPLLRPQLNQVVECMGRVTDLADDAGVVLRRPAEEVKAVTDTLDGAIHELNKAVNSYLAEQRSALRAGGLPAAQHLP